MIKYKIVAEHSEKGIIEIPISKKLLYGIADVPFMIDDCKQCWENFKLNKIDEYVKKWHEIILFLAFDVDGDGIAYKIIEPKKKGGKIQWKKINSNSVLIKKPKWKKKQEDEE